MASSDLRHLHHWSARESQWHLLIAAWVRIGVVDIFTETDKKLPILFPLNVWQREGGLLGIDTKYRRWNVFTSEGRRAQEDKIFFTDVMVSGIEHPEEGEDCVVWIVGQFSGENPDSLSHHSLLIHLQGWLFGYSDR